MSSTASATFHGCLQWYLVRLTGACFSGQVGRRGESAKRLEFAAFAVSWWNLEWCRILDHCLRGLSASSQQRKTRSDDVHAAQRGMLCCWSPPAMAHQLPLIFGVVAPDPISPPGPIVLHACSVPTGPNGHGWGSLGAGEAV